MLAEFNDIVDNFKSALATETDGTAQVKTLTLVGTATSDGTLIVTVTGEGLSNSPKVILVAILNTETATQQAVKARIALNADPDINDYGVFSGAGAALVLTKKAHQANDATMNVASSLGTATGITPAPTAASTTAGVAGTAQTASTIQDMIGDNNERIAIFKTAPSGEYHAVIVFHDGTNVSGQLS